MCYFGSFDWLLVIYFAVVKLKVLVYTCLNHKMAMESTKNYLKP